MAGVSSTLSAVVTSTGSLPAGKAAAQGAGVNPGAAMPRSPNWRPIVGGVPGQAEAEALAQAQAEAAARAAAQAAAEPAPDTEALIEAANAAGGKDNIGVVLIEQDA